MSGVGASVHGWIREWCGPKIFVGSSGLRGFIKFQRGSGNFGMGWSGFKICCGSGIWRELAWVKNFTGVRIRYSNCIYSESAILKKNEICFSAYRSLAGSNNLTAICKEMTIS